MLKLLKQTLMLLVICIIDIITTMIDMLVIGIVMITSIDITIFAWFQVYKRLCVTTRFGSTLSRESCACQHTSAIDRLVDLQLWLISWPKEAIGSPRSLYRRSGTLSRH